MTIKRHKKSGLILGRFFVCTFKYIDVEYYYLFSLNGLLRGDAKTRSEFYKNMNIVGALCANEIRNLEDMNSYEGGDEYFVQMNMQPVKQAIDGGKKTEW